MFDARITDYLLPAEQQDQRLLQEYRVRQGNQQYKQMQRQRAGLPAHAQRDELVAAIAGAQVVVCSGETGTMRVE